MMTERQLPLIKSRTATKAALLDAASYEALINDPAQCELSQRILTETDPERQQQLKSTLPAVIWMARCPADGHRPKKDEAVPSGLCFHDLDHLDEDPRLVYEKRIKPLVEELAIGLVKLSARGNGLHLVSLVPDGWTPQQTQVWVAAKCGLSKYRDTAVTDLSRLSYVSSQAMHLYYNRELLWTDDADDPFVCLENPPRIDQPNPAQASSAQTVASTTTQAEASSDQTVASTTAQDEASTTPTVASTTTQAEASSAQTVASTTTQAEASTTPAAAQIPKMYDNQVDYEQLVARIIDHYGGVPRSFGGRHEAFKKFAFALASIMDYSAAVVMHYLEPYRRLVDTVPGQPFGEAELRELVVYACQKRTYSQSREVRQALVECRSMMPKAEEAEGKTADSEEEEELDADNFLQQFTHRELKMPKLPGELELLVSIAPSYYRESMALCAMSPLMFLADRVTYEDLTGNERFLSNHTVLVGPASTSKGKIIHQTELLLKHQIERENVELDKVEKNKQEIRQAERSRSSKTVKEYEPELRILPPATSVNEYLRIQKRAGLRSLFMYTPEISNITAACGSGAWADLRTCFREGWDGDYHGQLRSTSNSFSGRVRLRLCVLAAGTPGQAFGYRETSGRWKSGFYQDKENGLASRLMIVYMPSIIGEKRVYWRKHTPDQLQKIENMTLRLETETGKLLAPRMRKTMERWYDEMCDISLRVGGGIIDEARKRAAVQGLACGYMAYLLEGRKDNNVVCNWARYCADICLRNYILAYVGQENNGASLMPTSHGVQIQDLLSLLPDEFTIQQVRDVRRSQGKSDNVKSLLSRLVAEGLIENVGKKSGIYRKR